MNFAARFFALPLAAAVLLTPNLRAQSPQVAPAAALATPPALYLGTAWYPEQWPESRWDADLALMEAAHVRFVRIGEFAWSKLEPSEGQYDLDWLSPRRPCRRDATTSPSSSERPAPHPLPGSPPNIPRPSASKKTAAATSTAIASSSTGPTPSTVS